MPAPVNPRIVIPARGPEQGKSRLAEALTAGERAALVDRLFDHALDVALTVLPPEAILVISRSPATLERAAALGTRTLLETGTGLNTALEQASQVLAAQGSGPILTLSADLPLLARDDIVALLSTAADVVCATDTPHLGTNALLQRRPGLIPYCYGPGSLAAHRDAARTRHLSFAMVDRPGLAQDLDTPEDLSLLAPGQGPAAAPASAPERRK